MQQSIIILNSICYPFGRSIKFVSFEYEHKINVHSLLKVCKSDKHCLENQAYLGQLY